jgi:hypothetical protein
MRGGETDMSSGDDRGMYRVEGEMLMGRTQDTTSSCPALVEGSGGTRK